MTKTHPRTWSALMAVVGVVVLMLGGSVVTAAPTAKAMNPSATGVTITVTPTILVSEGPDGELVTVGTVVPGMPGTAPALSTPAATTESGSSGPLVWIVAGLALVLAAAAAYWWVLLRRSATRVRRRAEKQP